MSNIQPDNNVKVTARSTNKSICAKVLGEIPQIRENEGLLLRLSDAACGALGTTEEKMDVMVNY